MHDATKYTIKEFKRNLRYYIHWLNGFPFRDLQWDNHLRNFNDISIEQISKYGDGKIIIAPFDLYELKIEFIKTYGETWKRDNAHMDQQFYQYLIKFILHWIQCDFAKRTVS